MGKKRILLKIGNNKFPFLLMVKIPLSQRQSIPVHFLVLFL